MNQDVITPSSESTTGTKPKKTKYVLIVLVVGIMTFSCIVIGLYFLSLNSGNSQFFNFVYDSTNIISSDMDDYYRYMTAPVLYDSLQAKCSEIHGRIILYKVEADQYNVSFGKEYLLQQEYKGWLDDLDRQILYTEQACVEHNYGAIDMESHYLDLSLEYSEKAVNHLMKIDEYLENI